MHGDHSDSSSRFGAPAQFEGGRLGDGRSSSPFDETEALLAGIGEPVAILDSKGLIRRANSAFRQRFGAPRARVAGRRLTRLGGPWSGRQARDALAVAADGKEGASAFRIAANGSAARGAAVSVKIRRIGTASAPVGFIVFASPCAASEAADRRRRERAAIYDIVLEAAPAAIVTIDSEGRIRSFSRAAERLFGYAAAELIGASADRIAPPAENGVRRAVDLFRRSLGGAESSVDVVGLCKNGARVSLDLACHVARFDHSETLVGVFRDLSIARIRHDELHRLQRFEALGRLTAGVAHDVNNLLTIIGGSLELLDLDGPRKQAEERIADALSAVEQGSSLTRLLLANGAHAPDAVETLDMNAEAGALASVAAHALGEGIAVRTRLAPAPLLVRVDHGLLRAALLNLILNARDAMPEGGSLSIETGRTTRAAKDHADAMADASDAFVAISIVDDGVGMPADILARASEPYFTTKRPGRGTGLGLSLVFGFARQAGGFVRLESKAGRGSRATIALPAVAAPGRSPDRPGSLDPPDLRGFSVILVEADPRVRRNLKLSLQALGFFVADAPDGATALAMFQRGGRPDLLVADPATPAGADGAALVDAARRIAPRTRVLFLTALPDAASALPAGAAWIGKPYGKARLARAVRRALAG
jgi:two-component system CheB/CheR fusion protein